VSAGSLALQWVLGGAFAVLGVLTAANWLRHRDHVRRYLALSVSLLGAVALLSSIDSLGIDHTGLLTDATLVLFAVSGWAFFRFRDDLIPIAPRVRTAVGAVVVATIVVLLVAYAPGTVSTTTVTTLQAGAALALLVVWAGCVAEPGVRIWLRSSGLPSVQRARLRSLVTAYAGIVLILVLNVVAGLTPGSDAVYRVVVTPLTFLIFPLFYFAFAPPGWIRRFWRESEEQQLRQALNDLLLYSPDRRTLAQRGVDWAARLLGAEAAMIATDDGEVLVTHGLDRESAWEMVRGIARGERPSQPLGVWGPPHNVIQVPLHSQFSSGVLAVRAGSLTPLFGEDEVIRLREYSSALTTALDRVLLVERLRRTAELLDLAYNPILTWSAKTGEIAYWNSAAESVYGWTAEEAVGAVASDLLRSELPLPREQIVKLMRESGRWEAEIGQVAKDGRHLWVSVRWALQLDRAGRGDVVLEINRDITRERQDAAELRRARDQAEKASLAKSEYLSRMSHELRTPLTAILGYSDLLELRDPRDDQLEAVGAIQEASSHLLSLVNDVLDIARIESGRDLVAPEPVSVAATIEECLRLVAPAARARNVTISSDIAGIADANVEADRQRLVQALLNLVSNAVKYCGDGATVEVRAEALDNTRLRLAVVDNGPGLTVEQQQRLFQPFERLGAERTTTPGTGLGLALTKKLVETMGGEIGVDSTPGVGSSFWIVLERAALDVVPSKPATRPPSLERPGAEKHTVLYVEDNLATISLMEEVFRMRPSITLISAMQGSMALDLARQHKPALIILDLHLPDVSGEGVLRQLLADPQTARIPVVMFSADATERQIKRLLELGARAYLVKPAKVAEFLSMLDEVLAPSSAVAG
jgi:PAS domain S-box-containing protein